MRACLFLPRIRHMETDPAGGTLPGQKGEESMRQERFFPIQNMKTRETDQGNPVISGLFVVYDSPYQVCEGGTESIAPGALKNALNGDIRALYNHNPDIVLGRTSNGTLSLEDTPSGLYGEIEVNKEDSDAMNAYARIKRGDISGASFGFDIVKEERIVNDDGSVHWRIEEIEPLYEVSPCVFPAYEATWIIARGQEIETMKQRQREAWAAKMIKNLKGDKKNGD